MAKAGRRVICRILCRLPSQCLGIKIAYFLQTPSTPAPGVSEDLTDRVGISLFWRREEHVQYRAYGRFDDHDGRSRIPPWLPWLPRLLGMSWLLGRRLGLPWLLGLLRRLLRGLL